MAYKVVGYESKNKDWICSRCGHKTMTKRAMIKHINDNSYSFEELTIETKNCLVVDNLQD